MFVKEERRQRSNLRVYNATLCRSLLLEVRASHQW